MPGWWFTIESTTTRHFIHQFKIAIEDALKAKPAVRAIMRARATKQRFPVSQWVEDLEKLQSTAIDISHKQAAKERRPTLDSANTPAILETPGVLSVLQSRLTKPSLRPRPAAARATTALGGLSSIAEDRLLAGPSPGLESKLGPGSTRKGARPPVLRNITGPVATVDFVTGTKDDKDESTNNIRRPLMTRSPTAPNLAPRLNVKKGDPTNKAKRPLVIRAPTAPTAPNGPPKLRQNEEVSTIKLRQPLTINPPTAPNTLPTLAQNTQETTQTLKRPTMERSSSGPQLRVNDRKAVRLLGMQLPASQTGSSNASKNSPSSSDDRSTDPSSTVSTPKTPQSASSGYYTPESTPPSTKQRFSTQSSTIAATSVNAADFNVIHSPHAVDMFPSLGPHYYPHGSVGVLDASDIKEEKPDNKLQNVTPFFSDPEKEYEAAFKQKLKRLSGRNSEDQLCIEEYLLKSEKSWFGKLSAAQLTKISKGKDPEQPPTAIVQETARENGFGLGDNYKPPSGLKRLMRRKVGDWPMYSFLLAFVSNIKSC